LARDLPPVTGHFDCVLPSLAAMVALLAFWAFGAQILFFAAIVTKSFFSIAVIERIDESALLARGAHHP
jgi:hypothetical protein